VIACCELWKQIAEKLLLRLVWNYSQLTATNPSQSMQHNSETTRNLEAVMSLTNRLQLYQALHYTILFMEVSEE
jgi:hypothetical protein